MLDQGSATYGPRQARGFILSGPPTMYERLVSLMYFLKRHSKLDNGVKFTPVFDIFFNSIGFCRCCEVLDVTVSNGLSVLQFW